MLKLIKKKKKDNLVEGGLTSQASPSGKTRVIVSVKFSHPQTLEPTHPDSMIPRFLPSLLNCR